jgi:hypothetical protein
MSAPPWRARLTTDLEAADQRSTSLAHGFDAAQLNWRSHPGAWSIGQCLDHLIHANETYGRAIDEALARARPGGAPEIHVGRVPRWFIRHYIDPLPDTRRVRAPRKIKPAPDVAADVLDRFLASNRQARELLRRASAFDVNRIRFKNPYVSWIRFTVGTGFEILSRHQTRHLLQAERIRALPGFPIR